MIQWSHQKHGIELSVIVQTKISCINHIAKLSQPYFKETSDIKKKDNNFKYNNKINVKSNNKEKKHKNNISNKIHRYEEQFFNLNKQNEPSSEDYQLYGYGIVNNSIKDDYNNINSMMINLDSIDSLPFSDI